MQKQEKYLMLYWFEHPDRVYLRSMFHSRLRILVRRGLTFERPRRGVIVGSRPAVEVVALLVRELSGAFRVFRVLEEDVPILGEGRATQP